MKNCPHGHEKTDCSSCYKKTWEKARKNLLEMLEKYPNTAVDIIDSAYLAGLEAVKELPMNVSEWKRVGKERGYWNYFDKGVRNEMIEKVKEMAVNDVIDNLGT